MLAPTLHAPRPVWEMRPVSAEGGEAIARRGFHNDHAAEIAVITSKPVVSEVLVLARLIFENCIARYCVFKRVEQSYITASYSGCYVNFPRGVKLALSPLSNPNQHHRQDFKWRPDVCRPRCPQQSG